MLDDDLKALMAEVPAHDARFALAVMVRIEQRQFRRAVTATIALALGAALLLALAMPSLQLVWQAKFAAHVSNVMVAVMLLATGFFVPRLMARD